MNTHFTKPINVISLIIITFLVNSCQSKYDEWTTESLNTKQISWNGSWENSKKLKLLYHGIKFYKDLGQYQWAFKVNLTYFKNNTDDTLGMYDKKIGKWRPPNSDLCIPVNKITYGIYDKDNFLIDSISIIGDCIKYKDTLVFQFKKSIKKDLIEKFEYGKLNIDAGYYIK